MLPLLLVKLLKGRGSRLSALPKVATSKIAGLFFTLTFNADRQAEKL